MTIPKIDPITPTSSSSPSTHFLSVGVLTIEGKEYTVSVESPDPLIKRPHGDTLDRIQDLVNLHLNHLRQEGVDLSTVVVQQLDEEGLSYVRNADTEDMKQVLLSSSEVNLQRNNPFYPSLQDKSILNISHAYRSLIDSLTRKSESENKEKTRSLIDSVTKKSESGNEEKSTLPITRRSIPDEETNFESRIDQTKPKQFVESSDETSDIDEEDEISESEDENVGLISGNSKDLSEYNQSGIINNFKFQISRLFSGIGNLLPNLRNETNAIDAEEAIAREESRFRSDLSSSEQATIAKFANIKFT